MKPAGITIGRGAECDVVLDDDTVSMEHARIRREDDTWVLYDLAAANRTTAAGHPIFTKTLADRDRVAFGLTEMVFRDLT